MLRGGVHGVCDRGEFLEKWHYYEGAYLWNGGSSGLLAWDGISEGYYLYCTKDYIVAINSCGNDSLKLSKIENSWKMGVKVPFLRSSHISSIHGRSGSSHM